MTASSSVSTWNRNLAALVAVAPVHASAEQTAQRAQDVAIERAVDVAEQLERRHDNLIREHRLDDDLLVERAHPGGQEPQPDEGGQGEDRDVEQLEECVAAGRDQEEQADRREGEGQHGGHRQRHHDQGAGLQALAAVTLDELAALTADLPKLPDEPARPVGSASHARHLIMLFVIAFVTLAVLVAMMLLHP